MAKKSINNGPKVPEACVRIQKLRRILGLSVSAFALECNYSRGHVSGIEHHVYMPTNGLLRKICVVFNVNPEWLIEGKSGLPVFMPSSSRTENTSELGDELSHESESGPETEWSNHKTEFKHKHKVEIGKRIRQLRKKQCLLMSAFGKKIGITASNISRLEAGKIALTEENAKMIEKVFGVGVDWLYCGDEKAKEYPLDDEMSKWIKAHPEARKKIKSWMNQ